MRGVSNKHCLLTFFLFILFYYPLLLLDNSIAYMFIHTPHAYAYILLHKKDGSKKNIFKGTVKGQYQTVLAVTKNFQGHKTVTLGSVAQWVTCLTRCVFDCRPRGC